MIYLSICAIGLLGEVSITGRLTLAEPLLALALPFLLVIHRSDIKQMQLRQFYILSLLWLFGSIITDVIRQTPIDDIFRGWSKIVFVMFSFTSIYLLVNNKIERAVVFLFLLLVAAAARISLYPNDQLDGAVFGNSWKFGYGQALAACSFLIAAIMVGNPITKIYGMILPFLDAAVNLALNARNLFGLTAIASLIFVFITIQKRAMSFRMVVALGFVIVMCAWGAVSIYATLAGAGVLGIEAKEKYEFQTSGTLGVFLGGRTESLASTQAIIDSPIIGHGSWARDIRYVELMATKLEQAGYILQGDPFADDLIPSHSHFFGAWVESGVLGALFWGWAICITTWGLVAALTRSNIYSGFIVYSGLSLLWNILFSPLGLEGRVITPASLVIMIVAINMKGKRDAPT